MAKIGEKSLHKRASTPVSVISSPVIFNVLKQTSKTDKAV